MKLFAKYCFIVLFIPFTSFAQQPSVEDIRSCEMFNVQDQMIDKFRATTFKAACSTSRWFDGLFGHTEEFDGSRVEGWINFGLDLDTVDGVKPRVRMSLSTDLPNANKRYHLFIGRLNLEEYVSNTQTGSTTGHSTGFKSTEDDEDSWMLGLGYQRSRKKGVVYDTGVGAKIRSNGLNPYIRFRRFHQIEMENERLFSTSQTLFWQLDEGYGFTADLKYQRILSPIRTAVFFPAVKYSSEEDKWEWLARMQFYRYVNDKSALKYTWFLRDNVADTDEGVQNELGLEVDYRHQFIRNWFYLVPTVTFSWERRDGKVDFEPELFLGLRVEMQFDKNTQNYYREENRSR